MLLILMMLFFLIIKFLIINGWRLLLISVHPIKGQCMWMPGLIISASKNAPETKLDVSSTLRAESNIRAPLV